LKKTLKVTFKENATDDSIDRVIKKIAKEKVVFAFSFEEM